jgi:hypothetical protein
MTGGTPGPGAREGFRSPLAAWSASALSMLVGED